MAKTRNNMAKTYVINDLSKSMTIIGRDIISKAEPEMPMVEVEIGHILIGGTDKVITKKMYKSIADGIRNGILRCAVTIRSDGTYDIYITTLDKARVPKISAPDMD